MSSDAMSSNAGTWVNISYSPCAPAESLGITARQMNLMAMRCSQFWLAKGYRMLFGHDWRNDGVMRSIADLAELTTPHRFSDRGLAFPRILNLIPHASGQYIQRYGLDAERTSGGMIAVRRVYDEVFHPEQLAAAEGGPHHAEIERADFQVARGAHGVPWLKNLMGSRSMDSESAHRAFYNAVHAGALADSLPYAHWDQSTNVRLWTLRAVMTQMLNPGIRICFGGKTSGYGGWMPGIFEEAVFALLRRKPLYLVGGFGGAATDVAKALLGKSSTAGQLFGASAAIDHSFGPNEQKNPAAHDTDFARRVARYLNCSLQPLADQLADIGVAGLSAVNGLSERDNLTLFRCTDIETACDMIHAGVEALKTQGTI